MEGLILLFAVGLVVIFKGCQGGFSDFGIEELLVDGGNKIYISDEISWGDSVLVDDGVDLIVSEAEGEEAGGGGEG